MGQPLAPLPAWARPVVDAARAGGENVAAALEIAREVGARLPLPGVDTLARWTVLAALGERNLTVARVAEPHADALAILAEAGLSAGPESVWGVYAAEAPGLRLDFAGGVLRGDKPWCSLAGEVDAALVTAHTGGGRGLFRVDLRQPGVTVAAPDGWVARGLRTVVSVGVHFDDVAAEPVGEPGWYLRRPGFAYGGLGVAAVWYGGAVGVLGRLHAGTRRDDLTLAELGGADIALHGARAALAEAATLVDEGVTGHDADVLAARVRGVVAAAAEEVLRRTAHALGPAPLTFEPEHAARVADLELYLRQHHAARDDAALGRLLTEPEPRPR